MREALLAFSDPALVERWQETVRVPLPPLIHLPYPTYDPFLKAGRSAELAELDPVLIKHAEAQNALRGAMEDAERKARTALEHDFRNRIASGEVVLEGLQFAPSLATARSAIPSVWAQLLIFQLKNNIWILNQKIKFMEVTAHRVVPPVSTEVSASAPVITAIGSPTVPALRPRGRASYKPLIEAALKAHWEEVQRRADNWPGQQPVWSELARLLHKRLSKEHRNSGRQIPHEQTIRTRLPDIYARLLSEKPVRK
nr:hypothetical protein [Roseomonas sp. SXEYE001]